MKEDYDLQSVDRSASNQKYGEVQQVLDRTEFLEKKLMARKIQFLILFLLINFGGLALGAWSMGEGPTGNWYLSLVKAPWTPQGWVFGVAWTTIMACFSVYLIYLFTENYNQKKTKLYILQVVLNISWNFFFFNQHQVLLGLLVILLLTALIFYFFLTYFKEQKIISFLLLPYMIWLCIATSLNLYILVHN